MVSISSVPRLLPRERTLVEIAELFELRKPRQAAAAKILLQWLLDEPEPDPPDRLTLKPRRPTN